MRLDFQRISNIIQLWIELNIRKSARWTETKFMFSPLNDWSTTVNGYRGDTGFCLVKKLAGYSDGQAIMI